MAKRYDQFCPIAHALSIVGERWALLVVRELLKGPRRYTDLAAGLPGIGTNVLATRLRELEAGGVVAQAQAAAAGRLDRVRAHRVRRAGSRRSSTRSPAGAPARSARPEREDDLDPEWGLDAFPALLYPERARGLTETYVIVRRRRRVHRPPRSTAA